jgi:hypothetical protein
MAFFILEPDGMLFGYKWSYAEVVKPKQYGDSTLCPNCLRPVSMRHWLPPHKVKLSSTNPTKLGDFLWGAGFPLMVSDKFKTIYKKHSLSGVAHFSKPVEITNRGSVETKIKHYVDLVDDAPGNQRGGNGKPYSILTFYLVDILWGGAEIDDNLSLVKRKDNGCDYCHGTVISIKNAIIKEGSWNGADIFYARGLDGRILVSEKMKKYLELYHLKNYSLVPLEQLAISY